MKLDVAARPRRRVPIWKVAVRLGIGCAGAFAANVFAAPGSPGVPGPSKVISMEDFEDRDPLVPLGLDQYKGGAYTADPYWLNQAQCNGIVYSLANIPEAGTRSRRMRRKRWSWEK